MIHYSTVFLEKQGKMQKAERKMVGGMGEWTKRAVGATIGRPRVRRMEGKIRRAGGLFSLTICRGQRHRRPAAWFLRLERKNS